MATETDTTRRDDAFTVAVLMPDEVELLDEVTVPALADAPVLALKGPHYLIEGLLQTALDATRRAASRSDGDGPS